MLRVRVEAKGTGPADRHGPGVGVVRREMTTWTRRLRVPRLLLLGEIQGDDALGRADLNGGEPDAGGVVHGLEHVPDQLADAGIDLLDRVGDPPQPLVGEDENVAQRHGRRCKRSPEIGQCNLSAAPGTPVPPRTRAA